MDRPVTEDGDGDVERRLVERFPGRGRSPMAERLERRTQWFDEVTLRCIEEGMSQVVIVAAGYDCRALRFRTPGVRFIELDHPATQADKQRILHEMDVDVAGVAYAAADFTVDDVGAALAAAGHKAGQATLFLVEGLLIYLPEDVIVSLLSALRARAAPESRLAVSISRGRSSEFRAHASRRSVSTRDRVSARTKRAPCCTAVAGAATPLGLWCSRQLIEPCSALHCDARRPDAGSLTLS